MGGTPDKMVSEMARSGHGELTLSDYERAPPLDYSERAACLAGFVMARQRYLAITKIVHMATVSAVLVTAWFERGWKDRGELPLGLFAVCGICAIVALSTLGMFHRCKAMMLLCLKNPPLDERDAFFREVVSNSFPDAKDDLEIRRVKLRSLAQVVSRSEGDPLTSREWDQVLELASSPGLRETDDAKAVFAMADAARRELL